eukprot:1161445-Pelagomonas_calceolata.AAC.9
MAGIPSNAVNRASLQLKPILFPRFIPAPPASVPIGTCSLGPAACAASGTAARDAAEPWAHCQPRSGRARRAAAVLNQRAQRSQQQETWIQNSAGEESDDGVCTPRDLTNAIQCAETRQQLHSICKRHRMRMNYIHAAAAITRLAKLHPLQHCRSQGKVSHSDLSPPMQQQHQQQGPSPDNHHCITDIAYLVATHSAEFQPRALANALWAVSKLAVQLQQEEHISQQQQQQQQEPSSFLHPLPAPDHSALTAVLDLAACLCSHLPQLAPRFEPQHCANTLHALASLQQVHDREEQLQQQQQLREQDAEQQHRLQQLQEVLACAPLALHFTSHSRLAGMAPQGLSNSLHAVACLRLLPEEAWLDAWLDEAQVCAVQEPLHARAKLPLFEPQHISNALWALGKLGFYPGEQKVLVVHCCTFFSKKMYKAFDFLEQDHQQGIMLRIRSQFGNEQPFYRGFTGGGCMLHLQVANEHLADAYTCLGISM